MSNYFSLAAISSALNSQTGLEHAILQSLLNWAKARANDKLEKGQDHRGWWANEFLSGIGCRDWTLAREKQTDDTRKRAKRYTEQALEWLITQDRAKAIKVQCQYENERLVRVITITLPDDTNFQLTL
ncbi:phage GP46 family protein [Thiomicrorhabdus sp.]|uniref:phage GP46 family protein n=1 Tax=Thiomicrorhabdus sp. TaxID=2039724 RepID=UPI003568C14D